MTNKDIRDKTLKLTIELDGRRAGCFEVKGSQLLEECASACLQVVRQLLTTDENIPDHGQPLTANDASTTPNCGHSDNIAASDLTAADTTEVALPVVTARPVSWDTVRQEMVPPYVKAVSFAIDPQDLTPEREAHLKTHFPEVLIHGDPTTSYHQDKIEMQAVVEEHPRQNLTPDMTSNASSTNTDSMSTLSNTSETTQATSKLASSRTSMEPSGVNSGHADVVGTHASPNTWPILAIANRLGLNGRHDKIHDMWSHWHSRYKVRPFAPIFGRNLDQYYEDLVTLYTLAYHNDELDLCYAVLLAFQMTNFKYRGKLPNFATAVLAFQHLPETSGLCRWIAILFAFLWGTQQYQSRQELLMAFPDVDKDAFAAFMFALAYIRDPFTKGHNTAVLDQWCEVHRHEEGDSEAGMCEEAYSKMKAGFEEIRKEEAEDEYNAARSRVRAYEESVRSRGVKKGESTTLKGKRKAGTPVVEPRKKLKRGDGKARSKSG